MQFFLAITSSLSTQAIEAFSHVQSSSYRPVVIMFAFMNELNERTKCRATPKRQVY